METYTSEDEQVDAVRRFFAENGKALAAGIVIGLVGLLGWKYWNSHKESTLFQASSQYETVSAKLADVKTDNSAEAEKFIKANSNSYGVFASLQLAQRSAKAGDFKKAAELLQVAQGQTSDESLLSLVTLRLARVQLQNKQPDDALKTLEKVKGEGWLAQADDVRGDILLNKGDLKGAKEAYSKGIESNATEALQALLRMKLNNLSS